MKIRENPEEIMKGIEEEGEKNSGKRSKWAIVLLVVLIVALIGATAWMYWQYRQAKIEVEKALSGEEQKDAEINKIVEDLKNIATIPDEQPTIATIVDVSILKEQNPDFYKDAKNGHKLILFTDRAIIFDAENKKVINMLPVKLDVNPQKGESKESSSDTQTKAVSVAILNGTSEDGLSSKLERSIGEKKVEGASFSVGSKLKASKQNYKKSVVWDASAGSKTNEIKQLADLLGFDYKVGNPDGEGEAATDVVVIIGDDYEPEQ